MPDLKTRTVVKPKKRKPSLRQREVRAQERQVEALKELVIVTRTHLNCIQNQLSEMNTRQREQEVYVRTTNEAGVERRQKARASYNYGR